MWVLIILSAIMGGYAPATATFHTWEMCQRARQDVQTFTENKAIAFCTPNPQAP